MNMCPSCMCQDIVPAAALKDTAKNGTNWYHVQCRFCDSIAKVYIERIINIVKVEKSDREEPDIR